MRLKGYDKKVTQNRWDIGCDLTHQPKVRPNAVTYQLTENASISILSIGVLRVGSLKNHASFHTALDIYSHFIWVVQAVALKSSQAFDVQLPRTVTAFNLHWKK